MTAPTAETTAARLRRHMETTSAVPGRTKRTAARLALAAAIHDGTLPPGGLLPPEKALTGILGVSLGTVQAALRQLQQVCAITRRRGDGTRVAAGEPIGPAVWHFRFVRPEDGASMRFIIDRTRIDTIAGPGPWTGHLGERPAWLRIRRRLQFEDRAPVGAEMILDPGLAPGLPRLTADEIEMTNIRTYLEERFSIVTVGADHRVRVATPDPVLLEALEMAPGGPMFEIHAAAFARDRSPVYFQRILVPLAGYALTFSGMVAG